MAAKETDNQTDVIERGIAKRLELKWRKLWLPMASRICACGSLASQAFGLSCLQVSRFPDFPARGHSGTEDFKTFSDAGEIAA